ncbi:MAG TPA: NupC/NupG family nucleoside CNT transporter [Bacillales bacterium]
MQILWGFLGIAVVLAVAFAFSNNRRAVNPRTVLGALAVQIAFALFALKWEPGREIFQGISNGVQKVIGYAQQGINFLFGSITSENSGTIFAFEVLPVIIFIASLIALLYYLGVMQWVIRILGGGVSKLLKTSKAESLSATANIFVGQIEAPLIVRPYIKRLTQSELFTVMTGGLASVTGSTLVGYALLGVPLKYLIPASFMTAPAGLLISKIMVPETNKEGMNNDVTLGKDEESANVIDAIARGASDGLRLALNVGAMLIAFIALVALLNGIIGGIGGWFGLGGLTLQKILGMILSPLAFAIGVPWDEAVQAAGYIGQKMVLNEFVAYMNFAPQIKELSDKTVAIVTFALCGFANIGSMAMIIGGLGGMAPNRRSDIARLGLRAVVAGTLANLLSAAIAGMMI